MKLLAESINSVSPAKLKIKSSFWFNAQLIYANGEDSNENHWWPINYFYINSYKNEYIIEYILYLYMLAQYTEPNSYYILIRYIDYQLAFSSNNLPISIQFLENRSTKPLILRTQDTQGIMEVAV